MLFEKNNEWSEESFDNGQASGNSLDGWYLCSSSNFWEMSLCWMGDEGASFDQFIAANQEQNHQNINQLFLMIQPGTSVFKYNPFRAAFIASFLLLGAWITLFVLTIENCVTNCFSYTSSFNFPCTDTGALYCCSNSSTFGPYYCGYYTCGGLSNGSWFAGSLLLLGVILMCVAAHRFKKLKQLALLNAQNNGSWGNMNQNYNNPPAYYQDQQFPNNQAQPLQPNYNPPRYPQN